MSDKRDPQQLGESILKIRRESGLPICEVADMLDLAAGHGPQAANPKLPVGRNTLCALPAKIRPGIPPPDVAPQERKNGRKEPQ